MPQLAMNVDQAAVILRSYSRSGKSHDVEQPSTRTHAHEIIEHFHIDAVRRDFIRDNRRRSLFARPLVQKFRQRIFED
jgi:hypothetical protein